MAVKERQGKMLDNQWERYARGIFFSGIAGLNQAFLNQEAGNVPRVEYRKVLEMREVNGEWVYKPQNKESEEGK